MTEPAVSIVVATLDRAANLARLLASLRHLDYRQFEVIVVNGPSRDGTAALLAEAAGQIKAATCPSANLAASRNIGLALAAGDIVAFLDDDAVPHPRWLTQIVGAFGDLRVGGVGGFTLDGSGVRFQARKTLCDRFGNPEYVSDWFDERALCIPGTPWYPSLLGTNAAFRRSVLLEVGGFDEVFAYYLDETDLCLRIVDRGYRIVYEPAALVFHHYAESRVRDTRKIPRSRYRLARSKAYFVSRHGEPAGPARIGQELGDFERACAAEEALLAAEDKISPQHRHSLEQDLHLGIEHGTALAVERRGRPGGGLPARLAPPAFRDFVRPRHSLAICMVSQGYPPQTDAGIARWTATAAKALAARGHRVHIVTRTNDDESIVFDGEIWLHSSRPGAEDDVHGVAERYRLPPEIAAWCARVYREVRLLKGYGIDLVSFPIWDLEGLPCLDDPDLATVVCLQTTYGLSVPYQPEWSARPIHRQRFVEPMIAAERECLRRAPILLANSAAVVVDLERCYGLDLAAAAVVVPHATVDLRRAQGGEAWRSKRLKVLYVGRFEERKGFDLALQTARRVIEAGVPAEFAFIGGEGEDARQFAAPFGGLEKLTGAGVRFLGRVGRERLERWYLACDVVLMPSRYESFGLVAIEAMAAGKPVLVLNVGGLREIVVHDANGWAIEPGDNAAQDLAEAIGRLASDRRTLARLARGARATYDARFTAERMAERLEEVYRAIVAGRRPGGVPPNAAPLTAQEQAAED